ncbi:hypothetical protein SEA_TOKKI_84 [Arthrobacter phage Tokki]|nr:hypothetical protein SEA_TOKKI_84 [Arthrobacter phage Tokki]
MVNKEEFTKLTDTIQSAPGFRGSRIVAAQIAGRIVDAGWALPVPTITEEQEIDLVERIISGLPPRPEYKSLQWPPPGSVAVVEPHPSHEGIADVKLYDVNSLYPQEVSNWTRIPTWDNYEINGLGQVRNRWTKRILDYVDDGEDNEDYVEMHDKEGYTHMCHIGYLKEQTFGK